MPLVWIQRLGESKYFFEINFQLGNLYYLSLSIAISEFMTH